MSDSFRRITLRDVARLAEVSHMTVSRVLRTPQLVARDTVNAVQNAIRKLGYRPDPVLSALAAYRSRNAGRAHGDRLAFLDCDQTPYSHVVLGGAQQEATLLGYGVDRFPLQAAPEAQRRLSRMLFHRGVRGLMFGPSDSFRTFTDWPWDQFAAVSLGALEHQPQLHAVAMDYFQGARRGYEILQQQGCRRIGLLVEPKLEARTGHRWRGGYLAVGGLQRYIYTNADHRPNVLRAWLRSARLEGLLTIHPGLHEVFLAQHLKVAYLNDSGVNSDSTHLTLNPQTIGAEAVRLLHHLLLRHEYGLPAEPRMVSLQGTWKM